MSNNPDDLQLDTLPDLPQSVTLKKVAARLWPQADVVALWVGGSLATGQADDYSDVDLFVAVAPEAVYNWLEPDLEAIFDGLCLARQFSNFGDDFFVHHLLLASGEIYDLHVQRAGRGVGRAQRIILGCRDPELGQALAEPYQPFSFDLGPIDPLTIQRLVEAYWFNTHKHRKVLFRRLDPLIIAGMHYIHSLLLQLYYILAAGEDCGDLRRATIHTMTPIIQVLQGAFGEHVLKLVGLPMGSRAEIEAAIETLNDDIAAVGRQLAAKHGFVYPAELEAVVRRGWAEFKRLPFNPGDNNSLNERPLGEKKDRNRRKGGDDGHSH